jgi:hypothetical protein
LSRGVGAQAGPADRGDAKGDGGALLLLLPPLLLLLLLLLLAARSLEALRWGQKLATAGSLHPPGSLSSLAR